MIWKGGNANEDEEEVLADMKRRASPKGLTIEDYLMWSMDSPLSMDFLCLLFQVSNSFMKYKLGELVFFINTYSRLLSF